MAGFRWICTRKSLTGRVPKNLIFREKHKNVLEIRGAKRKVLRTVSVYQLAGH